MSPPWLGSTLGLTSIWLDRPVICVVEGTPVAPGKVKRPGSAGAVVAGLVGLGEGADEAAGDLIELRLIFGRDRIAKLRIVRRARRIGPPSARRRR